MSEDIKKDSVYNTMSAIYKVLKKQNLITDLLIQKVIHADASAKTKEDAAKLTEEEKIIWYTVMVTFKLIFDLAGNYYKYKEKDPEKFKFLNDKRPFYQSMNRVDLTRAYIFEQAIQELKQMNFQDLERKTGILLDAKQIGNAVRSEIVRKSKEV
jgi:hypothetical protein